MTLKLTEIKQEEIFTLCEEVIKSKVYSIRKTATLLGNIVASFKAILLGPSHYRNIELWKIAALKEAKGKFERKFSVLMLSIYMPAHMGVKLHIKNK